VTSLSAVAAPWSKGIQATLASQLDGDDLVRVQNEIEAVERAMAEEKRAEFRL